ncbi:hypothetical protein OKW76_03160 [Sphingomonas sp. S1-29]|uniref:hypothetical protein n=1 Tax=Sphingomonas sp. S1-29 TaxID=2991074 RepID=UPI00223EE109|nr:hypothetical protein [Sphingomonas sp. S1-29]UZK70067.1 hypothetical protein OKW76_03160 [Sphingomonas sp. S1-29]
MAVAEKSGGVPREAFKRVAEAFLISNMDELMHQLRVLSAQNDDLTNCIRDASEGLQSVISAATLPFQLTLESVQQRHFDRHLAAERIRSLEDVPFGEQPSEQQEQKALDIARRKMREFIDSKEGTNSIRDSVVYEMNRSLTSSNISSAAKEMMVQTLVSTWAVFEHFASSFVVAWLNHDPRRSRLILSAPELKAYFGKQVVDIEAIDDHGFDLSRSMGSVIFRGRRLDNLTILRAVINAIFDEEYLRNALGNELWMLNQKRHLFVHKRGLIDQEYLQRTGDKVTLGHRLSLSSNDIKTYIAAVQKAIVAIVSAAAAHTE